jgi:hypothetical protein
LKAASGWGASSLRFLAMAAPDVGWRDLSMIRLPKTVQGNFRVTCRQTQPMTNYHRIAESDHE